MKSFYTKHKSTVDAALATALATILLSTFVGITVAAIVFEWAKSTGNLCG